MSYRPTPFPVTDDDMIAVRVALHQRIDRLRPLRRFSVRHTQWRLVNP